MVLARNEEMLRQALAGFEADRGVVATVTRRLYGRLRLQETREPLEFDEDSGTYDAWREFAQGPVNVAGTYEESLTFDDLPWDLEHGVKGGVAASADAGTPIAYTRLYRPTPSVDDLRSSTVQHGVPDNVYRTAMLMMPEFTIRGETGGDATWMLSANMIGRTFEPLPAGFTAGVPQRSRERIRFAGTKLFIDDLAANIGDTQVLAKFISFSVTVNNNVVSKLFAEDVDAISTRVGRGRREITGQIRLEFDNDDEKAKYRAGIPRAIRIEREGSIIHGAIRKRARIDIPTAYWLTPSDDPRDTNMTLTYGFRGYTDAVVGYPAEFEVVNNLATIV